MTQLRKLAVYVAFALMLLPFSSSSQETASLPLNGVNNWGLGLVSPPPYDVFDTLNTGMEIQLSDIDPTDSVQLFKQYGEAHRFPPNEWLLQFEWKQQPTQPQFNVPEYVLVDFRVVGSQNLQGLQIGIMIDDTSGSGVFEGTQKWVDILPIWQLLELDINWAGHL